jgi:hypothetical protein
MIMGVCIIYKITNIKDSKIYIGQTWRTLRKRAGYNGAGYKQQKHFWNAIKVYGWESFKTEIVCYAVSQPEADYWEGHFMRKFNSLDREHGYNDKSTGGNGLHSDETKKKISSTKTGKKLSPEQIKWMKENPNSGTFKKGHKLSEGSLNKISNSKKGKPSPNKGKPQSEEAKKKNSDAHKGKKTSEETKKKQSIASKGISKSEEHRKNISLAKSKFSIDQQNSILNERREGKKLKELAEKYGAVISTIQVICEKLKNSGEVFPNLPRKRMPHTEETKNRIGAKNKGKLSSRIGGTWKLIGGKRVYFDKEKKGIVV